MEHRFVTNEDAVFEILERIARGAAQCWVGAMVGDDEQPPQPRGVMITTITEDPLTSGRFLLLYALWAYQKLTAEMLAMGRKTLTDFAKQNGCQRIVAHVEDPRMRRYVQSLGMFDKEVAYFVAEVE
jgi:hypothetical protein